MSTGKRLQSKFLLKLGTRNLSQLEFLASSLSIPVNELVQRMVFLVSFKVLETCVKKPVVVPFRIGKRQMRGDSERFVDRVPRCDMWFTTWYMGHGDSNDDGNFSNHKDFVTPPWPEFLPGVVMGVSRLPDMRVHFLRCDDVVVLKERERILVGRERIREAHMMVRKRQLLKESRDALEGL